MARRAGIPRAERAIGGSAAVRRPPRDDQVGDLHHHRLAVLVERGVADADDATIGDSTATAGPRGPRIRRGGRRPACTGRGHRISSTPAPIRPPAIRKSLSTIRPHRDRRGLPAARHEPAEQAACAGRLVEVERLRVELRGERLDPLQIDGRDGPERKVWPTVRSSRIHRRGRWHRISSRLRRSRSLCTRVTPGAVPPGAGAARSRADWGRRPGPLPGRRRTSRGPRRTARRRAGGPRPGPHGARDTSGTA